MSTSISDSGFQFSNGDTQAYPSVPVRQTVLSGPVDSSGFSAFGGSTGGTTITASGTLIATAANGTSNRTGSIVNPSWTGLSTNGTMYLGLTVNADGTCTPFSTTLVPIYQPGGTFSVTSNQRTFNTQAMQMQVGNGATAAQSYDVFVGEVTVAAGVVSAITWYALMGQWIGVYTSTFPAAGTAISQSHNIGISLGVRIRFEVECITTDLSYAVGDILDMFAGGSSGVGFGPYHTWRTRLTAGATVHNAQPLLLNNKSTGAPTAATLANWKYRFTAKRDW